MQCMSCYSTSCYHAREINNSLFHAQLKSNYFIALILKLQGLDLILNSCLLNSVFLIFISIRCCTHKFVATYFLESISEDIFVSCNPLFNVEEKILRTICIKNYQRFTLTPKFLSTSVIVYM